MRWTRMVGIVAVGVPMLAGCGSVGPLELGRDGDPLLRTDRTSYTLQPTDLGLQVEIPFTFDNRTGGRVFLVNCRGAYSYSLEKRIDGEWIRAWSPVLQMCLSPPIVIEAGDTFADTLHVYAGDSSQDVGPTFEVDAIEGVYRIIWDARRSYDQDVQGFGEVLPLGQRMSNAFELEDPR